MCGPLDFILEPDEEQYIQQSFFSMKTYLVSSSVMTSVTLAEGSPSLTSITIPDSVTSIGKSAFSGCTGLKTAVVERAVQKYLEEKLKKMREFSKEL